MILIYSEFANVVHAQTQVTSHILHTGHDLFNLEFDLLLLKEFMPVAKQHST